jgi:hypothetical protein
MCGIERRAALMRRNPIFAEIFSVLTPAADASLTHTTPTPTSSPAAAVVLAFPRVPRLPSVPLQPPCAI